MKVKPLRNHLLVELVENGKETKSGIILTEGESRDTNLAKIIETADSYDEDYDILFKGDKVLINPSMATKVNFDSNEYYIIDQKKVLGVIR